MSKLRTPRKADLRLGSYTAHLESLLYMRYTGHVAATDVRTQLYLPDKLHRALKRAAKQRGVSMAQLLREAAEDAVRKQTMSTKDPLEGLVGAVKGDTRDLADDHDRYLYGLDEGVR